MKNIIYNAFLLPFLFVLTLTLNACGGSGGGGAPKGQFIDAAVEGITYTSGSITGETDANGFFSYEAGQTVTFSIGGIVLGTVTGSAIITPVQLINGAQDQNNAFVTNIVQLLLTIDDDQDASNGIQITPAIRAAAENLSIDFTLTGFDTDSNVSNVIGTLTDASSIGNLVLVTDAFAQVHLLDSLFSILAASYSGTFSGDDTGSWTITVATDGTVTGTGNSNSDGAFSITGNVSSNGTVSAAASGSAGSSTWSSIIDITNGTIDGTWSGGGYSGIFSGNKQ